MNDHILTNLDDTFNTSDSNLGKIEGLKGNDSIIVSGELARQIDGDQGDDDLSGAEVIFGGSGNDTIANAHVAYGLDGNDSFGDDVDFAYGGDGFDTFEMRAGSYADGGSSGNIYRLNDETPAPGTSPYAVISHDPGLEGTEPGLYGGPGVELKIDADFSGISTARVIDADTGQLTTHLILDVALDYDLIIRDYFVSTNDDVPSIPMHIEFNDGYLGTDIFSANTYDSATSSFVGVPLSKDVYCPEPSTEASFVGVNDIVHGTEADDHLEGFGGDDRIFGRGGDDGIEGDQGDDRLFGMSGDDVLFGGAGSNRLDGGSGDDRIHALGDQDEVWGDAGSDVIFAGADETTVWFEEIGDDAAISETDTIHKFDLGQDKIMIEGQAFDASSAAAFLAGNAMIDGEDLFIDLGDGRAIKVVDIVQDDDEEPDDFIDLFLLG